MDTVLLVEDDPDTRMSTRFVLEAHGYAVVTAENGEEALTALSQGLMPCLIVLDLMMPVMDGFQFRREQLRDPRLASIPVVVYSGHFEGKSNAERLAAAAYFEKPVEPEALINSVRTHSIKPPAANPLH